ncbi:MAG: Uncharacterized protein MJ0531, partial [uncultured Nocardioides sp.]
ACGDRRRRVAPVAARCPQAQGHRRPRQDLRHLGGGGDPAAGRGRLRRRALRGDPRREHPLLPHGRPAGPRGGRSGVRGLGTQGAPADPQRLSRHRDHPGRRAVRRRAGRHRRRRAGDQRRRARRQHRAPRAELRTVPGARRAPDAEGQEEGDGQEV